MTSSSASATGGIAAALGAPFVPDVLRTLDREARGYVDAVWPQLQPSVETAGFLGSALYMADMSLDAVEEAYEPLLDRDSLLDGGALTPDELQQLEAVLDVFHWVQPQLLLMLAALAEAWDQPSVGGRGRVEPREHSERELAHLETEIRFAATETAPLPLIVETLHLGTPPDLYRAVACWPRYLAVAWDELQHMSAYPPFRRRGRALYYYARASSRFLARPLQASRDALRERGLTERELDAAHEAVEGALPELATMMMHCTAMRLGLGISTREVVNRE